jgi:hypothetical protein
MRIPSRISYPLGNDFRRGHNTVTSYPLFRSEQASLQTRRSKGTGWFSTMTKILFLATPRLTVPDLPAETLDTPGALTWTSVSSRPTSCCCWGSEFLPTDAAVLAIIAPVVRNTHKVYQALACLQFLWNALELSGPIANDNRLSML